MKKWLCWMMAAVLTLSLCACSGGENPPAKVGATLTAPEKTVSLNDYEAITLKLSTTIEGGVQLQAVRAARQQGGTTTYYQQITQTMGDMTNVVEHLCTVGGDKTVTFFGQGGQYQAIEHAFTDFSSDDQYFAYCFGGLGFDYASQLDVKSLTKGEDATVGGRDCYTYKITYTDPMNMTYDSEICVDKETGIWMRESFKNEEATGVTEVTGITFDAAVIPGAQPVGMAEQVIYDQNGLTVTAKSLDFSNPNMAAVLHLQIQNTADSDMRVYTHHLDVNGLSLAQKAFDVTCPAGETVDTPVEFSNNSFKLAGIDRIQEIALSLYIEACHTETSGDGSYTVTDRVVEQKTGDLVIKTDCPASYQQPVDKTGTTLIDTDEVTFIFQEITEPDNGTLYFKAYCVNNFGEPIRVTVNLLTINGVEYDDFEKARMPAQSEGYTGFYLYKDDLLEKGVEDIESLTVSCEAFYGETFNSTRLTEETAPVTLNIP